MTKLNNIWFPKQKEPDEDNKEAWVEFWKREASRCINGFTLADGQVYISGWLYFHTVYWIIELDKNFINPVSGKIDSRKVKGTPLFRDVEWMIAGDLERAEREKKIYDIQGARGFGKDLEENTLVHKENESVPIKDINIGDRIFGADGKLTTIIDKLHYSDQLQYRVTLSDGRTIECGGGHLWNVYRKSRTNRYDYLTIQLKDIYKDYLEGSREDSKYFIEMNKSLEYKQRVLPIDPYFFGLWLGDGNSHNVGVTTMDEEVKEEIYKQAIIWNKKVTINFGKYKTAPTYTLTNGRTGTKPGSNEILEEFRKLNVINNKHIPDIYLRSSTEQRMELLRGLMDSDGYCSEGGAIEFTSSYEGIQETFIKLINSLGIRCKYTFKKTKCKDSLRFKLFTDLPIFKLTRKLQYVNKYNSKYSITNRSRSAIVKIEPLEIKPSVCIAVDNDSKLFLAGDNYIVTHNSFICSSYIGHGYTFYDDSESLLTGGNHPDIAKLAEKVNLGLSSIHPVFQKQRIKDNWKVEVRAGWKDTSTGFEKGSGSRIITRNYDDGNNTMATNGTRPKRQIIDETGKIPNLIKCLLDSMPSWMNDSGFFSTPVLAGTGGDQEFGADSGVIFNNPRVYNVLEFEDKWEGKGNIGRFVPVTQGRNEYKNAILLSQYLGVPHPELDNITILVSDEKRCMEEFVTPRRANAMKSTTSNEIIKEKAYYPITPSECFLTISSNDFPIDAIKEQLEWLNREQFKPQCIEIITNLRGDLEIIPSNKRPVSEFPVKSDTDKEGVIEMVERPVANPPFGLYVAGIDPYKASESDYSDSLGSIYIFKRMTNNLNEPFQYMPVAWYTGRPKRIEDWNETVRRLIKIYSANAMCENADYQFIQYMIERNEAAIYMAEGLSFLKELTPSTKHKATYGLPATLATINHWTNTAVIYAKEIYGKEHDEKGKITKSRLGVTRILDRMLLEEMLKFNKNKGNYDRCRAFGICVAHARTLDSMIGKAKIDMEYTKKIHVPKSPFNLLQGLNRESRSPFISNPKRRSHGNTL